MCRTEAERYGFRWRYADDQDKDSAVNPRSHADQDKDKKRKRHEGPEEVGEEMVGKQLGVCWEQDDAWHTVCSVTHFDAATGTHTMLYEDGDEEQVP